MNFVKGLTGAVLLGVCILAAGELGAHPPRAVELAYDHPTRTLNVRMRHATHDPREDCIRKLMISKNGVAVQVKRYNIQPNALVFEEAVEIDAAGGDVLTVKAYSREGGVARESLTVTESSATEE